MHGISPKAYVSGFEPEEFSQRDEGEVEEFESASDAWWLAAIVGWFVFIR